MQRLSIVMLMVTLSAFSAQVAVAQGLNTPSDPQLLRVTVEEEDGSVANLAHVYIFSCDTHQFVGMHDVDAVSTIELPSGSYRIYAAITRNINGYIDHYTSSEARVRVGADADSPSLILALHKADLPPVTRLTKAFRN